jgi:hypothetical protein
MSAENVVINFQGKADELQPAENALDSLIKKEGELGAAWAKTSEQMAAGSKQSTEFTNKLSKSIEQMAAATKSMDKAVIGGAYKKYLKEIQQQLGLTNKELIAYEQQARKSAQANILNPDTKEDTTQITLSIEAMNTVLSELGVNMDETGDKSSSLKARIAAVKLELTRMAEAGQAGTPAFVALQKKGGELDDQMRDLNATLKNLGSDTANIEGLVSIASGVAGGFAVAQGAAALFGDGEEEVQKALLKVNAAMSILQGLQQIQNVLQKESQATLLLKKIFLQQVAVATVENTVATEAAVVADAELAAASTAVTAAEGAQAVATDVATESQIALNTAMELNPIALVIAAVVALGAAVAYLALHNNNAAKEQANLNDALQQATSYLDINLKSLEQAVAKEAAIAKQRGASVTELASIEGKAGLDRLKAIDDARVAAAKAYNESKDNDKETIESRQKLYDRIFELQKQYQEESNALRVKGVEFDTLQNEQSFKSFVAFQQAKVAATIAGSDNERSVQVASIRAIAAEREKSAEFIALTDGEKALKRAEDERQIQGLQLANYQHYLKGKTSAEEAEIAKTKLAVLSNELDQAAGIKRITDLEISAIKKRRDEQLKGVQTNNSGEIKKINDEANLAIAEAERKKQLDLLAIDKAGINARLILSLKGTEEEYNNKIAFINKEQEAELLSAGKSAEKIAEINAKYERQRIDANKVLQEARLQNEISIDNAALDVFGLTENEKLALVLDRLDKQRELEIIGAEGNAAKIVEINAKYDKQIIESKKATITAILDDNLKTIDAFGGNSKLINEKIIRNEKSTFDQRKVAINQLLQQELLRLDLQAAAEKELLDKKVISQHEYDVAVQNINNQRTAATIKNEEDITAATLKEIQKRTADIQGVFNILQKSFQDTIGPGAFTTAFAELENFGVIVQDVFARIKTEGLSTAQVMKEIGVAATVALQAITSQIFADQSAGRKQQLQDTLDALEEQKNAEINVKNITEQQKAEIEKKFKEKEKQEKIKAFNADKEAKKQQAIINGALGVLNALATAPTIIAGIILAALVVATTAVQVAKINSTQPPKYKRGKVNIDGPGTGTSDSIHAMISKGESVINAKSTSKYKDVLEAINDNQFEQYLSKNLLKHVASRVPDDLAMTPSGGIDYDKLATSIASKMAGIIPAPRHIEVINDSNGQRLFIRDSNSKTEYKNQRYSMI